MKNKPIIQAFKTPNNVFVDMQNGSDYVLIPLRNLDKDEVEELLNAFAIAIASKAGYTINSLVTLHESNDLS